MTPIHQKSPAFRARSVRALNLCRRERDFVAACRAILSSPVLMASRPSPTRIVEMALSGGAPSYYVSVLHASGRVQAMLNHPLPPPAPSDSPVHQLWREILRRVSDILNSRRWISLDRAVSLVLERGNASSFFMSKRSAMRIFHKHFTPNF